MATKTCKIRYGKEKILVEVPEENLIGVFEPKDAIGEFDEEEVLRKALASPIGLPPINKLAKAGQKIAIVVDDNTRPTPTAKILPVILEELEACGIKDQDITIVFANGSHRLNTEEEKMRLLGGEHMLQRFRISDHNPHDVESLRYLGKTSRGTPVHINRYVAEADLRILTGLIKPHGVAGYTGGGKSILPGVSSLETIISDHNYAATGHHMSINGVIDGNLIRNDIEEAAHLVEPCFILNVILDNEKKIVDAVAGDMVEAHRAGAKKLDEMISVPVPEIADIVIAGCSYPTSVSLYQSANLVMNCTRLVHPIVKKGGIIVAASPCTEGIGSEGPFRKLMKDADSLQGVLDTLSQPGFFEHDQWAAQLWTTVLIYCDVYLVSHGLTREEVADMKTVSYDTVEEALQAALEKKGKDARILVLPDAPYTFPCLEVK